MPAFPLHIEPSPDFARFERVLRRDGEPDRVPFFELFSNIQEPILAAIGRADTPPANPTPQEWWRWHTDRHIEYQHALGYDYVNIGPTGFGFPQKERPTAATKEGVRSWYLADTHTIGSREDFDAYAWPPMDTIDYSPLENLSGRLPTGMKTIPLSSGVLENVMWLLGYEPFSILLFEDPELVRDMFDAVGSRIVEFFDRCASYDVVGAVCMGDDMGFNTQTMVAPDVLREYCFPWHKRLVDAAHRHGKPAILHSCGNLDEVMDDLIACGWDAKHSYEDAVTPVWEAKERWGDRIAVLGGFDMDKVCRYTPEQVRTHTRTLIERCAPGGGWALGTGNSVANYVPVENFLTMLDEGFGRV
ncbi:uroporphyrinogen-III decarboxylase-like protein [Candidatus Poribacteria bacterium]|nr:uroporphyrinogen-III decarboxylase-like protein [Candidatus Poribacteria bacterium]